jgi:hypothetical protein
VCTVCLQQARSGSVEWECATRPLGQASGATTLPATPELESRFVAHATVNTTHCSTDCRLQGPVDLLLAHWRETANGSKPGAWGG